MTVTEAASPLIKLISVAYSLFIFVGFISIPIAILVFGFGR